MACRSSNLLLLLLLAAALLVSAIIAGNRSSSSSSAFDSEGFASQKDEVVPVPVPGAFGPESLAFDSVGGGPYTGVSDGRIIKWEENEGRWMDFATTSAQRWVLSYHELVIHVDFKPEIWQHEA